MTVFLLLEHEHEGTTIWGCFSTEERAEAYRGLMVRVGGNVYDVEAFDVDEKCADVIREQYWAWIRRDDGTRKGQVIRHVVAHPDAEDEERLGTGPIPGANLSIPTSQWEANETFNGTSFESFEDAYRKAEEARALWLEDPDKFLDMKAAELEEEMGDDPRS